MRNESCEPCQVPLMKNKAKELYCVSCGNYYTLKGNDDLVLLRKGPPPKELGIKPRPVTVPTPVQAVAQVPAPAPQSATLSAPQIEQVPLTQAKEEVAQMTGFVQGKAKIIESIILPALQSHLAEISKSKPTYTTEGISMYLKNMRMMYEEITKYMDDLAALNSKGNLK